VEEGGGEQGTRAEDLLDELTPHRSKHLPWKRGAGRLYGAPRRRQATFACTPALFPDMMAAAIQRRDMKLWAARHEIVVAR
jgi:hypothetical protein